MKIVELLSSNPAPGELQTSIEALIEKEGIGAICTPVRSLREEKSHTDASLEVFLQSLSDSPGARKVVREFYRERYGEDIDVSDPGVLNDEIGDIDDILHNRTLPLLTKDDLREYYGVEGIWGLTDDEGNPKPYLAPEWVKNHDREPYIINETSGTTGEPWKRAMTRNDWAIDTVQFAMIFYKVIQSADVNTEGLSIISIWPDSVTNKQVTQALRYLHTPFEIFDYEKIESGGTEGERWGNKVIEYANSAGESMLIMSVNLMMQGRLGVELRQGNLDLDIVVNGATPLRESHKKSLESFGCQVFDVYGESERPQELALETTVEGETGYLLPSDCQMNLVYDPETDDLKHEGDGHFAYFPFGSEGHIIPGVYLSGVRGTIERVGGGHQLLKDVERIEEVEGGCADL